VTSAGREDDEAKHDVTAASKRRCVVEERHRRMTLAIAVMARAPIPGRCKTRLLAAHPEEWVAALQRAMLEDTLERLDTLPATVRVLLLAPDGGGADVRAIVRPSVPRGWDVTLQHGADLGARLESAMSELFTRAPSARAVIVGSDCPHLPAFDPAADEDVLIGPTDDGGYYLIAPRTREPRLFRGIAWSTPRVMEQTRLRCAELGMRVRELPRTYDIDEPADVERLANDLADAPDRAPRTARILRAR
jgi:rSAM/selenodomain-associated transferase 1